MKSFKLLSFFLSALFLFDCNTSFAQALDTLATKAATKDTASKQEKTHFIIGALYNSNMNYYGRVDSLKSSGICPFIGLAIKNGLYLNATFIFIHNNQQSRYAASVIEGGYNFKSKKGNWAGNISASGYFYQSDINLVQSAVKESFAASISNLNKIVNITLGANAKLSDKTDWGAQAGLDHIIRFPNIFGKDVIVLDPTAVVYAGTQNLTETYYQKRNVLFFPMADQAVTKNSQLFNILAYECSLPIVYAHKKFNLIVTPAYIIPQHVLTVPDEPALSERAANLFYLNVTVKFTL